MMTDARTDRRKVQVLSCAFAAKNIKLISYSVKPDKKEKKRKEKKEKNSSNDQDHR